MLVDSPLPALQIGMRVIVPTVFTTAGVLVFLVRLAVQAQRQKPVTGDSGMIGQPGRALTSIDPGGTGRVQTHGEIWTATASEPITAGDVVRVEWVEGLLLTVRPEKAASAAAPRGQYHS